jgi:uncharacterized protein (DUF736 family)
MLIGKFTAEGDGYKGWIEAFALKVDGVRIMPMTAKLGAGPDYVVSGETDADMPEEIETYELGAAWKKTSKKGKPYLSVKLDGPTLAAPINCALTQLQDGSYGLIWNRRDKDEDHSVADEQAAA